MKRLLFLILSLLTLVQPIIAKTSATEINWLTMDELQAKMKAHPKKVYIDMYTDWCGWCKVMESKTFTNPDVIKYMNDNYYCVRFNAERQDVVNFMGREYPFDADNKVNLLALQLMKGKLSFPTSILMEEGFENPVPVSGYLKVSDIEVVLKYFGENAYQNIGWADYKKAFKHSWKDLEPAAMPPAGH